MLHAAYGIRAEKFQDELKIMTKLRHQNIVRLVGYCHHTQQVPIMHEGKLVVANKISMALCLEHMPNGSLHELISGNDSFFLKQGLVMIVMSTLFYLSH
jgi:serine/threonine protein kinase